MDFELHQKRGQVSILISMVTPAPSRVLGTGQAPDKAFTYSIIYCVLKFSKLDWSVPFEKEAAVQKHKDADAFIFMSE